MIRVFQEIGRSPRQRDESRAFNRPTIDIMLKGDGGNDRIGLSLLAHELSHVPSARPPAIDILLAGDGGNDWLGLSLLAPELDDELLNAVVDGGRGRDSACADERVIVRNVEYDFCPSRLRI